MPVGHVDPHRRDRIIEAATDCIAETGVAGTSHRKVAARAHVPLGSMTYHFTSMDELLREVFDRFARAASDRFAARLETARDASQVVDAVVSLIHDDLAGSPRELVLSLELYTLATREPAFRTLTRDWMARSRRALEQHVDPVTARELDALIEGLTLHLALELAPHCRQTTANAVARIMTPRAESPGRTSFPHRDS